MPCNAVATVTAKVSNEEMYRQLDHVEMGKLIGEHLEAEGVQEVEVKDGTGYTFVYGDGLRADVTKRTGRISVRYDQRNNAKGNRQDSQALAAQIKAAIDRHAGELFQIMMLDKVAAMVPMTDIDLQTTDQGTVLVMSVQLGQTRGKVLVWDDGETQVMTDDGGFEDGARLIEEFMGGLGVDYSTVNPPEQHRHGPEAVRVHAHAGQWHRH